MASKYSQKDVREEKGLLVIDVDGKTLTLQDITALMGEGKATADHFSAVSALGTAEKNRMLDSDKKAKESEQKASLLAQQSEVVSPVLAIAESVLQDSLGVQPKEFRVSFVAKRISIDIDIPEDVASEADFANWSDKLAMKGLNFSLGEDGEYVATVKQGTRGQMKPLMDAGFYVFDANNEKVGNAVTFTIGDNGRATVGGEDLEQTSISHVALLKLAKVQPEKGELNDDGTYSEERPFTWPAKQIQTLSVAA